MSKDIQFSPSYGRETAAKIGNRKNDIANQVTQLERLIKNDLCQRWKGQASEKYLVEFTSLKQQVMDKFITMLGELQAQLVSVSNAIEQADNDIASKIKMR